MDEETIVKPKDLMVSVHEHVLYSKYLKREVIVDIYIPRKIEGKAELLLINDGQDVRKIDFAVMLNSLISAETIDPLVCAAIHCGADRIDEYGTACMVDYKGRGVKARLYNKFILEELLPFLTAECLTISFSGKSFAGFSMGGLSALDIVWNHPHEFSKAGVFSGALWWRRRGYDEDGYNEDTDRIMHRQVQEGVYKQGLQFFFECGRLDETADRNNNGIIDSIEDTRDLIEDLKALGYTGQHIEYLELEDGRHNVETWARSFPAFLKWGWERNRFYK